VSVPLVPVISIPVVLEAAPLGTVMVSVDVVVNGEVAGGVTGLGLKPPVTPAGKEAVRITGELKPPEEVTVTIAVPVPPGLRTRLLGLVEMLNIGVAVTVNDALAERPVFPNSNIV